MNRSPSRLAAAALLFAIMAGAALAPLYARFVSRTDPFRSTPMALVAGRPVLADNPGTGGTPGLGVTPIGPAWRAPYLLGADNLGRDVAARLLYGGRLSLGVAAAATALSLLGGTLAGALAGFAGGLVDKIISALIDLLWAFPVYLLAISLSIVLVNEGLHLGPLTLEADNPLLPILIIGLVYVPYVARPVRAEMIALQSQDYVEAAIATGGTRLHLLRRHLLPALRPTLASLLPILAAMALLTEAALSILGLGIQPPAASWGTLLADGQSLLYTRPLVALAPGLAIATTVLSLNLLTDRTP
ncbi:MAG: ABC transporter permease [Acetobacteraceae bacterium]|nr:ABC transporter permease [Acetobacteraceae bacterium]